MQLQLPAEFVPDTIGPGVLDSLAITADDVITLPLGIAGWAGYQALFGTLAAQKLGRIWSWSPEVFQDEDALRVRAEALLDVLLRGAQVNVPDADLALLHAWIDNRRVEYIDRDFANETDADKAVFYALTWLSVHTAVDGAVPASIPIVHAPAPWWIPCDRNPLMHCDGLPPPDAAAPSNVADVVRALELLVAYLQDNSQPDPRGWWDAYGEEPIVLLVMRDAGVTWSLPAGPMPDGVPQEQLALDAIYAAEQSGALAKDDVGGARFPWMTAAVLALIVVLFWRHHA